MWRYNLHNAYLGYDWLVVLQTLQQIGKSQTQHYNSKCRPHQRSPLAPHERIVLYILGREELFGMKSVHITCHHLESKLVGCVDLTVHLHLDTWQRIQFLIKTCKRIWMAHLKNAIRDNWLGRCFFKHFNTRNIILRTLEMREHYVSSFLCRHFYRQMSLLAYKYCYGIYFWLYCHVLSIAHSGAEQQWQYVWNEYPHYFLFTFWLTVNISKYAIRKDAS